MQPYNFHWQLSYRLKQPLLLKAGTKIECVAYYDNSRNNPNNPDPEEAVRFGPVALRSPFKGEIMNVLIAFEIMLGCTGVGFAALIYMEVRKIRKGKLV